jgi:hypothetical protein
MNAWFRRLLLVLTVGGGFLGLALTLQLFATADKAIAYLTLLASGSFYLLPCDRLSVLQRLAGYRRDNLSWW